MKKIALICAIFIIILTMFNSICFAAASWLYPKEYVITIKNVPKEEINKIELLYQTTYGFQYSTDEKLRYWITYTDFGYKYKEYADSEIIPKLSTQEIDEIAKSQRSDYNADVSTVEGYWRETIYPNDITKYAICKDVQIEYLENDIKLSYLRERDAEYFCIRIEKNDGTIIYSAPIDTSLVEVIDEHTSLIGRKKAEKVLEKTAYFECEYKRIRYKVEEIIEETSDKEVADYAIYIIIIGIIIILGAIVICKKGRRVLKNKNKTNLD